MSGFTPGYLEAKKLVDERCLSRQVRDRFCAELAGGFQPRRVLDLGAGSGSFLERLLQTGIEDLTYCPLDADASLIESLVAGTDPELLRSRGIRIRPIVARIEDYISENEARAEEKWGLLVSNAFLDLLDIHRLCAPLLSLLPPGGLFCFTMIFDGVTSFLPRLDPKLDDEISSLYHESMNGEGRSGSRAGRILFDELHRGGVEVLEAGASDWVILPPKGRYKAGEKELLGAILDFHEDVFSETIRTGRPLPSGAEVWLRTRRNQLIARELGLLTHQWDILGRAP